MIIETNYDPKGEFFHDSNGDVHVIAYERGGFFQVDIRLIKDDATPEQMKALAALIARTLDGEQI